MSSPVVAVLSLAFLVLSSETGSPYPVPEPARPGEAAPIEVVQAYMLAQEDLDDDDAARIKAAIEAYFSIKALSKVAGVAYDLGFVIDRTHPSGLDLYNYELGRMQYSLACWEMLGISYTQCTYEPQYLSISLNGNVATVELWLSGKLSYADLDEVFSFTHEPHTISLVKNGGLWLLVEDVYSDEFTQTFPPGTDFAELERTLVQSLVANASLHHPTREETVPEEKPVSGLGRLGALLAVLTVLIVVLVSKKRP